MLQRGWRRVTSASLWVQGARPRTLGAAVAPVLVGTAAAVAEADGVIWWRFGCALVVALALQVGVNYANDYSDGVRGTDKDRKGPVRLTATGLATPGAVEARRVPGVRRGRGRRSRALARGEPVAVARRRRRHRRRVALHRRADAVRLPRPRRAHGARVLRVRGDGRLRVRAGEGRAGGGVVGLARGGAARVRDPPRQQRPRRPHRRGHREAHARGAGRARPRRGGCSSPATSGRSRRS